MKTTWKVLGMLALVAGMFGCRCMAPGSKNVFTAQLSGQQEMPAVTTDASGTARFYVNQNDSKVHYKLVVHQLTDVTMAHLHLGMIGANGEPIVGLYPKEMSSMEMPSMGIGMTKEIHGTFNGVLAKGSFTTNDLAGFMKGKTIADLVSEIKQGDVYINVHTKQHPDGEIRGQLHAATMP
ncbi:MAG: CHRD domain-containing protein [Verrucomicrobia bacterium]|nr:CHRD domain-containing protein [Verrucomicrobiota bacterium]